MSLDPNADPSHCPECGDCEGWDDPDCRDEDHELCEDHSDPGDDREEVKTA